MLKMVHKRKSNKKNSKEGVILVTVLFILAMAMIFITSAILLTSGTRSRLYTRAEENQARLTATSVAESFYAAIEMHEVDKSMVQSMDGFGPIQITAAGIPGMAGTSDDYTTVEVNKNAANGTYNVDIKTVIGTQDDRVRLVLEPLEEQHFNNGGFNHQVEVIGGGQLSNVRIGYDVGTGERYEAADNTILSRGTTAGTPIGSTDMYSTFITTGGFTPASGSQFHGDVIVWGPDAGVDVSGINGNAFGVVGDNAIYFINNDNPLRGYNGGSSFAQNTGANVVVSGTSANFDGAFGNASQALGHTNGHIYTANGGSAVASGVVIDAISSAAASIQTNLGTYGSDTYIPDRTTSGEIYYWEQCAAANHLSSDLSGGTAYSVNGTGIRDLAPGTYQLSGSLGGLRIVCDLSAGNYIFYCPNGLYIGNHGLFEFVNSNGVNTAIFVIGKGKTLEISSDSMAGIIDSKVYGVDGSDTPNDRTAAYTSGTPDQSYAPCVYVFGAGMDSSHSRQIYMSGNQGSYLTAYCALYPEKADSNDEGSFEFYNSVGKYFYGRINAHTVFSATGGHVNMPYCPSPNSEEDPDAFIPIQPDYDIIALEYYYVE